MDTAEETSRTVLVTHFNPDLDACTAVWLLTRYVLQEEEVRYEFVPVGTERKVLSTHRRERVIYIDTGGGKYDHHGTSDYVCAASLVAGKHSLRDPAVAEMVKYALAVDHGEVLASDVGAFDLLNVLEGLNKLHPDDPELVLKLTLSCLDAIHLSLSDLIDAREDLKRGIPFRTEWGKGIALTTSNRQTRYLAHRSGFEVFVYIDPDRGFRGFMAPGGSEVDFTSVYERITEVEPDADWFLHSSKQLLLCGSSKAPGKRLSSLSLEEMVDLVRR